jgi:hypothetical protein
MKSLILRLTKTSEQKIKEDTLEKIIDNLELQKKMLSQLNEDQLDEAYANGLDMAIFLIKEMKQDNNI